MIDVDLGRAEDGVAVSRRWLSAAANLLGTANDAVAFVRTGGSAGVRHWALGMSPAGAEVLDLVSWETFRVPRAEVISRIDTDQSESIAQAVLAVLSRPYRRVTSLKIPRVPNSCGWFFLSAWPDETPASSRFGDRPGFPNEEW